MGRRLMIGLLVSVVALASAATAGAADTVYWGNLEVTHLGRASLAGGGSDFSPAPVAAQYGIGTATDAATGKVYWADAGSELILSANLDGTGSAVLPTGTATVAGPHGLAIDPVAGKVFWAAPGAGKIAYANLDGSGGADLNLGAAPVSDPQDVAVDAGANRVYWVNYLPPSIGYADLDGSGGGSLAVPAGLLTAPDGIAIDPTTNRVYWTNSEFGATPSIGWASLAGGLEGGLLPIAPATLSGPLGLAIDTGAGRLYWANEEGNSIASAALDGSGAAILDTTGTTPFAPAYPALLKAPKEAFAPALTGGATLGSALACAPATWAPDPIGTGLSWAPQSTATAWTLNGATLAGATGATLTATQPGAYACRSIATNAAGQTIATSPTIVVAPATSTPPSPSVRLIGVKLDRRHGTATVLADVSGPGTLSLSGKKVVRRSVKASGAGVAKLKVAAKAGALKTLIKANAVKVRVKLAFVAAEGAGASATRAITLRRAAGGRGAP